MSSSSCNLLKASEERPVERSSKNVNFLGRPGRPHSLPVGTPTSLSKSSGTVDIEGIQVTALFDSSNSESLICPKYQGFKLSVLRELCADLILGIDFQSQHSSVVFHYGGSEPPLSVDGLSTLKVDPPELFVNPTRIATKLLVSFVDTVKKISSGEVKRLLREGIREPSRSPWRAQVVVITDENHKKRLAIDLTYRP